MQMFAVGCLDKSLCVCECVNIDSAATNRANVVDSGSRNGDRGKIVWIFM